ncbi:MAG: DUF6787 family protein [Aquaticitalea sp.]
MNNFKKRWEIQHNWQLLFPILGVIGLIYASYIVTNLLLKNAHFALFLALAVLLFFILLKFTLFIFKKLENKWIVTYRWEMIRIFIVFAVTGSSSMFVSRPIMMYLGITKENLNLVVFWILYGIIGLIFYQILLVSFGWLFGQFQFFWEFEKKMLKKMGFKRFID